MADLLLILWLAASVLFAVVLRAYDRHQRVLDETAARMAEIATVSKLAAEMARMMGVSMEDAARVINSFLNSYWCYEGGRQ